VSKNLFYDVLILGDQDDAHSPVAFGTTEGVYLVDFLDKPCLVLEVPFGWFHGLQDAGDQSVLICFLPLTPQGVAVVAVVAVVADHLFTFVGNMGTHGGHPLQRVESLIFFLSLGR